MDLKSGISTYKVSATTLLSPERSDHSIYLTLLKVSCDVIATNDYDCTCRLNGFPRHRQTRDKDEQGGQVLGIATVSTGEWQGLAHMPPQFFKMPSHSILYDLPLHIVTLVVTMSCLAVLSSAFYDQHMPLFQAPEICSTPLEDLILQVT